MSIVLSRHASVKYFSLGLVYSFFQPENELNEVPETCYTRRADEIESGVTCIQPCMKVKECVWKTFACVARERNKAHIFDDVSLLTVRASPLRTIHTLK